MVYTVYFDSLPDLPETTSLLPLTLVSRQLRKETMPLFWRRCTFNFSVGLDLSLLDTFRQDLFAYKWEAHQDFAGITRLRVMLRMCALDILRGWSIDLNLGMLWRIQGRHYSDPKYKQTHKWNEKATAKVKSVVQGMMSRPKYKRFMFDDIEKCNAAVWPASRQGSL